MLDLQPTDALYQALAADNVEWALLAALRFKDAHGGMQRLATAPVDVVIAGSAQAEANGTFAADNTLIGASPLGVDSEPGREPFVLTFADPVRNGYTRWIDRFSANGYVGVPLWVWLTFWHAGAWTSPLTAYTGRCIQVQEGVASGGTTATVAEFAGPLAKLSDLEPLILTPENLRRRGTGDTFLDYVHVARNLQWGKKFR